MNLLAFFSTVWLLPALFFWEWQAPTKLLAEKRTTLVAVTKQANLPQTKTANQDSLHKKSTTNPDKNARFFLLDNPEDLSWQIEPAEKPSKLPFRDSVYVLLPNLAVTKELPQVYKLRLIGRDSNTVFQDYRLIVNAANQIPDSGSLSGKNQTFLKAHWQLTKGQDLLIHFNKQKPNLNPPDKPVISATNSSNLIFWEKLVFLLVALVGVYGLLWATSRFLVFSIKLKPADAENFKKSNLQTVANVMGESALSNIDFTSNKVQAITGELNLPEVTATNSAHILASRNAYFFTELLLTAGPRKKYMSDPEADIDLGEDVCGLVADHQKLLLWVLDGTSDQYCLRNPQDKKEYFSSRLLAQSIANKLRLTFKNLAASSLDELLQHAILEVKMDWLQSVQELPLTEQAIIRTNIENKNIPECATTLLFGTLTITGDLTAYRSGDCKMVVYTGQNQLEPSLLETPLHEKNEATNDRLFFRLVLTTEGEFDILHNIPRFEIIRQSQVSALSAFTDGIGLETEACLKDLPEKSLVAMREAIIYQLQGTADDKAICFVEIREIEERVTPV